MKWKKVMLTVGLCSSLLLLSACSSKVESKGEPQNHTEQQSNGDIREETSGKEQKPEFLANTAGGFAGPLLSCSQSSGFIGIHTMLLWLWGIC